MPNLVKKQGEKIPAEKIKVISTRFNLINKAISREFWLPDSDFRHSMYVGSYGRNTAISSSDIDILVELPIDLLPQYENLSGNVQSRLLQIVKDSLVITYSRSDVRADGQVVKIAFSDDTSFEIVPALKTLVENIYIQIQTKEVGGDLQIQRQSKKLCFKKTEKAMVCLMIPVNTSVAFEIIIFQVIVYLVLL